ncbi:MAG: alpha/beta hydrolase [Akkermansia sp.]
MLQIHRQRPIHEVSEGCIDCATIFIGGFGDWLMGVCDCQCREFPEWGDCLTGVRAYYHWDGGSWGMLYDRCLMIADDVNNFCQHYPEAHIILVGHSYGGSAAMEVARHLEVSVSSQLIVLTLDAVSRRQSSARAERVDFWGNAYLSRGGGWRDVVPRLGGRWGDCDEADINLSYDGYAQDADGFYYSHLRPGPMLMGTPTRGEGQSLFSLVRERLLNL